MSQKLFTRPPSGSENSERIRNNRSYSEGMKTKDIIPKGKRLRLRFHSPPSANQETVSTEQPVDQLKEAVRGHDIDRSQWKRLVLGVGLAASGLAAQGAQAQVVSEVPPANAHEQDLIEDLEVFSKDENGQLGPNLPEPTSAEEAKAYKDASQRAEIWENYLGDNLKIAGRLKRLDNTRVDLNSEQGIVVIHRSSGEGRRTQEDSRMLKFDTVTGQILEYEANVEGKNFVTTRDKPYGAPVQHTLDYRYSAGPMDSITRNSRVFRLDDGGEVLEDTLQINETAPGRIEVTRSYRNTFD